MILGYFIHQEDEEYTPLSVMVVMDDGGEHLMCYCPAEGHCKMHRGYFEECRAIPLNKYLEGSGDFYTPKEYINWWYTKDE